ncbi:hypothetical protein ES702_02794 [subsurface metagenome]
MVIVKAGVGAIVALLATNGFTKIQEKIDNKNGNTILSATSPEGKSFDVQIKNNAIISPQFDLVRITTSETVKQDDNSPIYELKNESSVIKRIFSLSIVPDATFQTEGLIAITLNGVTFFPITNQIQGDYTDISAINIPIPDTYGLKILPKDKLKVFIWNPSGNPISASVAVFIGELP